MIKKNFSLSPIRSQYVVGRVITLQKAEIKNGRESALTLQGTILLSQYWKNLFDATVTISYSWGHQ